MDMDLTAQIAFGIALSPLFVFFAVVLLMAFSLPWAPFAALICALIARARGLPVGYYAKIGALYSALLFLPWVYLVARMLDKTIPNILIRIGYVLLYVVWLFASIFITIMFAVLAHPGLDHIGDMTNVDLWLSTLLYITVLFNAGAWFASIRALRRAHAHRQDDRGVLPAREYIMPFAYALAWLIVPWLIGGSFRLYEICCVG